MVEIARISVVNDPILAGQSTTSGAHEVTVYILVESIVDVVNALALNNDAAALDGGADASNVCGG